MLNHEPKSQNGSPQPRYPGLPEFQCSTTSRRAKTPRCPPGESPRFQFQCSTTSRRAKTGRIVCDTLDADLVSVLNHEPKSQNHRRYLADENIADVSVLNHEPKSQNRIERLTLLLPKIRFSAQPRAEEPKPRSGIARRNAYSGFQCSTTSRRAKTEHPDPMDRAVALFQCSTTSRRAKTTPRCTQSQAPTPRFSAQPRAEEPKPEAFAAEVKPQLGFSAQPRAEEPKL